MTIQSQPGSVGCHIRKRGGGLTALLFLMIWGGSDLRAQTVMDGVEARFAYVGTYTRGAPGGWSSASRDEAPVGVSVFSVGAGLGDLALVQTAPSDNPSYVTMHPSQDYLYVLNEIRDYGGDDRGTVEAYAIDDASGELTFINRATVGGIPAQIAVSPSGEYLAVAAYMGATFELLAIGEDGGLNDASSVVQQEGSGPHSRQTSPHPHAVVFDPGGKYIATADLGTDEVKTYSYLDGVLEVVGAVQLPPGSGPRHVTFHPRGDLMYVINELTADIASYEFNASDGSIGDQLQVIATLPQNFPAHRSTAEIMLHPSGNFLYASNRKFEDHPLADSIVTYSVGPEGVLRLVEFTTHDGIRMPRTFAIDPTGTWLYGMGQKGDMIVQFHIDQGSGALTPTGLTTKLKTPVSMAFKR